MTRLRPARTAGTPVTQGLRVLLVLEASGGGTGRHVLDLARGLTAEGHEVHLAWSPERAEPAFREGIRAVPRLVPHRVPMGRAPGLRDLPALRALGRLLQRHGPFDLVHGHSSKGGALARLACAGAGIPCIYTPHALVTLDPQLDRLRRLFYRIAERLLARLGDCVICVSLEELEHAVALGLDPDRLVLVPNGLGPLPPADREAARQRLNLAPGDVCIGYVGRLAVAKAVSRLLDAFSRCPDPTARLAIVGDGPERPALVQRARDLGIADRVRFTGPADGRSLMPGFDVFALPSRYEGFPYVLLEAAACALPIVTFQVGGASAVVRPGENGFIVPQQATGKELGRYLEQLVSSAALRTTMGRRSAVIVRDFTAEKMVRQTLAVYRRVLGLDAGPGTSVAVAPLEDDPGSAQNDAQVQQH